jgi:hypothetical protein
MSYCRKCGAKLEEDAKFCPTCGTPVNVTATSNYARRKERPSVFLPALILIALLFSAFIIIAAFMYMPINPVSFSESQGVSYSEGVDTLRLNFSGGISLVNVQFENMSDKLVQLNVSASGGVSIFASSKPVNVTFDHSISDNILTVNARVITDGGWPWSPWLRVTCNLYIHPSLESSLNIKTTVGKILCDTKAGVTLNSLNLETGTGQIEAKLVENTTVNGDVSAKTSTGHLKFSWDNVKAQNNVSVTAQTVTGAIDFSVLQNSSIPANVTLNAQATTGGIDLGITIHDDVAAIIKSTVATGDINFSKTGFNGTKSELQSNNYPTSSNFIINLQTTTGGIDISAVYSLTDGTST